MSETTQLPRPKIRTLAWVSFSVSALAAAFETWSETSASSSFYYTVLGPANEDGIFLLLLVYLVAIILEVAALVLAKGWRNRVIVLAGTLALLVPSAGGGWIVGTFN